MADRTIQLTLSEDDERLLLNDISDADKWLEDALAGKINKCWKRFYQHWLPLLMADPDVASVPATRSEFIALVVARDDYKSRLDRDAEAAANDDLLYVRDA